MDFEEEEWDEWDDMTPELQEFFDYVFNIVEIDPIVKEQLGEVIISYAFEQGNTALCPLHVNRTSPAYLFYNGNVSTL